MGKTPVERNKAVWRSAAGSSRMTAGIERQLGRFARNSGRHSADTSASEPTPTLEVKPSPAVLAVFLLGTKA